MHNIFNFTIRSFLLHGIYKDAIYLELISFPVDYTSVEGTTAVADKH
jgi:hypothetical protein